MMMDGEFPIIFNLAIIRWFIHSDLPEPAVNDDALFQDALVSLFSPQAHTRIALGHVRKTSSGADHIPDPHPIVFREGTTIYTFIHNGNVDKSTLLNLLTDGKTDYFWINQHPPQTFGHGDWHTDGWNYVVDSELFFLWLVRSIQLASDEIHAGMNSAISILEELRPGDHKNFVFSDGEDLYAYRSNTLYYPDLYYALPTYINIHFAIMSSPPATSPAGEMDWLEVPSRTVMWFTPGNRVWEDNIILTTNFSEARGILPTSVNLSNHPNLFNTNTEITFSLSVAAHVLLTLFDLSGKPIRKLSGGETMISGDYQYHWDGKNDSEYAVGSGIYIIRLQTKAVSEVRKLMLIR